MKNFVFMMMFLLVLVFGMVSGCGDGDGKEEGTDSSSNNCPNPDQIPVGVSLSHPFELLSVTESWQNQAASIINFRHEFIYTAYNANVEVSHYQLLDLGNGEVSEQQLIPVQSGSVDDGSVDSSSYVTELATTLPEGVNSFKLVLRTNYIDGCFEDPEQAFLYKATRTGAEVEIEILGEGEETDGEQESFLFNISFIGMILVSVEGGEEASWETSESYDYGFQRFSLPKGGDVTFLFGLESEMPKLALGEVEGAMSLEEILQELSLLDKDGNSLALSEEQVEGQKVFLVPTATNQDGLIVVTLRRTS